MAVVKSEQPFADPMLFNLVFGHKGGMQPTPEMLAAFRSFVPSDALWGVTANPTIGSAMILFTFSFEKRIQSHPAATPINILHPTEIQTAFIAPGIPVVLINGENANDKSVGAIVLLISEQMPNTPPRIAPAAGPNKIAPRITGMRRAG